MDNLRKAVASALAILNPAGQEIRPDTETAPDCCDHPEVRSPEASTQGSRANAE
jgi:hypothetical protein